MGLELLAPGEREQPANQLASLLGGALGHAEDALLVVGQHGAPLEQAEPANHRRQQIVEIMRDAAGQLADRVHFLGLDQLAFERPLLADVGQGAGELDGSAVRVLQQHRLVHEMLVIAVGALPAIFDRRPPAFAARLERGDDAQAVVGVKTVGPDVGLLGDFVEAKSGDRFEVAADVGRPPLLGVIGFEVEDHRQRLDDRRLALLGPAQLLLGPQALGVGAQIGVEQGLLVPRLALDLLGFVEQVDEHRDLGPQDDRIDRLEHIIDGAHRIAAKQMLGLLVDRRQEDDRNALGLVAGADDLGGLVTVHSRHVDVEQDHRELALEQVAQRFLAGTGEDDLTQVLEDGRDGEQVAIVVVDQQHARAVDLGRRDRLLLRAQRRRGFLPRVGSSAYSAASSGTGVAAAAADSRARATHTRSSARRSSMSTGLAI